MLAIFTFFTLRQGITSQFSCFLYHLFNSDLVFTFHWLWFIINWSNFLITKFLRIFFIDQMLTNCSNLFFVSWATLSIVSWFILSKDVIKLTHCSYLTWTWFDLLKTRFLGCIVFFLLIYLTINLYIFLFWCSWRRRFCQGN